MTIRPDGPAEPGMLQVDLMADRRSWGILVPRESTKSVWTAPDLWKTPQNGVSHEVFGRRPERAAHTAHTPSRDIEEQKRTNANDTNAVLHEGRLTRLTITVASLR